MNEITTKIIDVEMIRRLDPCYDPVERGLVNEGWTGTVQNVIDTNLVPTDDKLWLLLQGDLLPQSLKQAFSRWAALQVAHLWDAPGVVIKFLKTGDESLRDEALAAIRAAGATTRAAARDAANWAAARGAALAAIRDTAGATTRAAARGAALAAIREANWEANWVAIRDDQFKKLVSMIKEA